MIPDWPSERKHMVERQLRRRDISDPRVLEAMGQLRREDFLPLECRVLAYRDEPAPIGYGQTISQPYMTALMAQNLELTGTEKVLDIGSGCGYAAAVLALLAREVISIEIVPALAAQARENLKRAGISNATVIAGDGSAGLHDSSPYDAISVTAGAPAIPQALIEQLQDPGRLVIPVGPLNDQTLLVILKRGAQIDRRTAARCRFVPLRGQQGWK